MDASTRSISAPCRHLLCCRASPSTYGAPIRRVGKDSPKLCWRGEGVRSRFLNGEGSILASRRDGILQARVEALAVADGDLEGALVGDQHEDVAGRIQHGSAVAAVGEVLLHGVAELLRDGAVDIVRNLVPHMPAI